MNNYVTSEDYLRTRFLVSRIFILALAGGMLGHVIFMIYIVPAILLEVLFLPLSIIAILAVRTAIRRGGSAPSPSLAVLELPIVTLSLIFIIISLFLALSNFL